METDILEESIVSVIEKFYPCEIFTQKDEKGDNELIIDFTVQTLDQDKEILLVNGARLTAYRKNPVLLADHNFSVRSLVGSAKWVKKMGDRIRLAPRFGSTVFAQDVKSMVEEKHLKTVSHSFKGYAYTTDLDEIKQILKQYGIKAKANQVRRIYTDWEPVEVSFVVIPSNRDAFVQYAKDGFVKTKSLIDMGSSVSSLSEYLEKREKAKQEECNCEMESEEDKSHLPEVQYKDGVLCDLEGKPYPNFHSCRINSPDKYPKIRYEKCGQKHEGKCIDVVWGILAANKSEIQALRYPVGSWTVASAKAHCKTREGSFEAAKKEDTEEVKKVINQTFAKDKYEELQKGDTKALLIFKENVQNKIANIERELKDLKEQISSFDFEKFYNGKPVQGKTILPGEQGIQEQGEEFVSEIGKVFKGLTKKEE